MAFTRPTLAQIYARIKADMVSRLTSLPILARGILEVLARVFAGAIHLCFGYVCEWLTAQMLPSTATEEYLDMHADIWGVTRRAATFATGNVDFTGTNGTDIPAGTKVQTQTGIQYETDALVTIATGTATAAVTAVVAGVSGNCELDTEVTLVEPISGIDSVATVAAGGLTGGVEIETDEELRARLLLRLQNPPQGGALADYEQWALSISGVGRVFIVQNYQGVGTLAVFVVTNDPDDPIPAAGILDDVDEYIQEMKPVTAIVTSDVALTELTCDFTIKVPSGTATVVKTAIEAQLKDLIWREGEPGGTILLSHIDQAIAEAEGEVDHEVVLPAANIVVGATEFPLLGTITWQDL